MHILKFSELVIPPNRQRKQFDPKGLLELETSITNTELLHAPVLRNDLRTLVCGERRIRAMQSLNDKCLQFKHQGIVIPPDHFPFTPIGELDEIQLREAELSENISRLDLTWQEKNQAIADLHALRLLMNPGQTKAATAMEITGDDKPTPWSVSQVTNALLVARNIHRPGVVKAKNTSEAIKIITKEIEQEFRAESARRAQALGINTQHRLIHGSFQNMTVNDVPPFDCIIADPPYGVQADTTFGDMADLDHEYDDSYDEAMQRYEQLAKWAHGLAKQQCHAYIFLEPIFFHDIWAMFSAAGWWVWEAPIIWDKGNRGLLPHPSHGPRRVYEAILFANKGNKTVTGVYQDIIRDIPNIMNKVYAVQKPVELYRNLIRRSCIPGSLIVDPTCGSGPIFPAATKESCTAIGIEQLESAYTLALERLTGDFNE